MNISRTLLQAKEFIDKGNHKGALVLIKDFEENEKKSPSKYYSCQLLKCEILRQQGLYEDLINLADQIFGESLNEKNNLQSVDALFYITEAFLRLFRFEEAHDKIKEAEELLESLKHNSVEIEWRLAYLDFLKGWYYYPNDEVDLALEHLMNSLKENRRLHRLQDISVINALVAWIYGFYKTEMDLALEYGRKALKLAEEVNKKYYIAIILNVVAALYNLRGELDQSIELQEESLKLFRELNNKSHTATLLNNLGDAYRMKGDLESALDFLEKSVDICFELGFLRQAAGFHDFLIKILVEKGNLERANQYLKNMEKLKDQLDDADINVLYLSNKASILKTSPLERDQIKAKIILEDLLRNYINVQFDVTVRNILNLCEIYISEFQNTSKLELLDQMQLNISQMIDIAKNQNFPYLLVESYLLEINLNLIKFDLKKVEEILTDAQNVAEKYDMNQLIKRISKEKEHLIKQKDRFVKLERPYKDSTMIEFSEIAPLRTQINYMLKKRELFKSINI